MPVESTMTDRITTRAWGVITFDQIRSNLRAIGLDPKFTPGMAQLVVLEEVKGFLVSFAQFQELARINPFGPTSRRAFVTKSDLTAGVLQTFTTLLPASKGKARVFRAQAEAEAWLTAADVLA